MVKKFLVGALTAVLMVEGVIATTATSEAAKVPKAKYTYSFDKADKNLVAVGHKKEDSQTGKPVDPGAPTKVSKKIQLKKGKKGKALYLDRTYGVKLNNMKLKAKKYTIAFWVKTDSTMSDAMPIFFAGNESVADENTKWFSVTKQAWLGTDHSPVVWSHNGAKGEFPWTSDISEPFDNMIVPDNGWLHIAITVGKEYGDAGKVTEYMTKGDDGYTKGNNCVIYVNGELYGTGTPVANDIFDGKETAYLGINYWDTKFKGYIDELKIYNKALSEEQVQAVMKGK